MADEPLRAGAATSNITPPLGVSLNGGMQDRAAAHIHDELHARGLVLARGETKLAIVVCDSCMLPRSVLDKAKHQAHGHTGIPMDRMLVSATHTHTAPTAAGVFQSEPDAEYCDFLARRISDCIRRAVHNLEPAKVGWGMGREPSQVFNRRWKMREGVPLVDPFGQADRVRMNPPQASPNLVEPAGPVDPEAGVLAVQSLAGRPLALLANYSLHYVGGTGPGDVSADYYGVFAERVSKFMAAQAGDPPLVAMMSNGTSGNINNVNFREQPQTREPYAQIRAVAELLAAEAARVAEKIEYRADVPLAMREAKLRLGRRLTPKDDVARAKFILSQAPPGVLQGVEAIYARETVLLNEYPPFIETLVQAIRIGDLGIASSPCETFAETGLAIKAASPLKPTFTIELANDYCGYLPTAEQHELGGYETWRARSSFLEIEAEAKIRKAILGELSAVATS